VLVSDLAMPDEDGLDLIQRVRKREPAAGGASPALALSAYARPEESAQALAAGFDVHLAKPVDQAALLATLARLGSGTSRSTVTPSPSASTRSRG